MVKISPVYHNFADRAKQLGRKFVNIPLKDGSSAKISWNDNACDCFIVKNNKIGGCRGAYGRPQYVQSEFAAILDRIQKFVVED